MKQLKRCNLIIVSYADDAMSHVGYVYQATNWIYTGQTKGRTDKFVPNGKHSRHYDKDETETLRVVRSPKHRYIYFAGDKRFKRTVSEKLRYPIEQYPKGESKHYELGTKIKRTVKDTKTGRTWQE